MVRAVLPRGAPVPLPSVRALAPAAWLLLIPRAGWAGGISGTVHNELGEPLVDLSVQVFDQHLRGLEVRTDATGAFAFPALPAGHYRLRGLPDHGWDEVTRFYPAATSFCDAEVLALDSDTAPDLTGVELVLPMGARLSGALTDAAGEPVPGATVWAVSPQDESAAGLRAAFTDGDGAFEIRGLDVDAGLVDWAVGAVSSTHPEQYLGAVYEEEAGDTFAPPARESLDIGTWSLLSGIRVSGAVQSAGAAVTEGTVHVYAGGQVRSVALDENGDYDAIGLPPGDVLPWVSAPGVALTYWPDHDRPTVFGSATEEGDHLEGMDLDAPPEATVAVALVDAETGTPLGELSALLYNDTQTVGLGGNTSDDGVLSIDGMSGGDWMVYVWAAELGFVDGFLEDETGARRSIAVETGVADQAFTLPVPRAAVLSGQVVDEDGLPVENAAVVVLRDDGQGEAERTDADGAFTIGGLPGDTWQLWAEYSPYCPQDPAYVTSYWGDTVNPDWQEWLPLATAERREDVVLVMQRDADQDEMGDRWEADHGLDPTRDDAAEDPDGDEYTNLEEFRMGTDPQSGSPGHGCQCGSSGGWLLLLPLPLVLRRRS